MFGVKTYFKNSPARLTSRVDLLRLRRALPNLVPSQSESMMLRNALSPAYTEYVTSVSTPEMASSLETAVYLYHLCRATSAQRVLDLGSGFSSYVLRRYAEESSRGVTVTSVDTDGAWLSRTKDFLDQHGLVGNGELLDWNSFERVRSEGYSVVFHDIAGGAMREAAMTVAVRRLDSAAAIVFDDAQHLGHRRQMYSVGADARLSMYSLRKLTLDGIGRYAVLGFRSPDSKHRGR